MVKKLQDATLCLEILVMLLYLTNYSNLQVKFFKIVDSIIIPQNKDIRINYRTKTY